MQQCMLFPLDDWEVFPARSLTFDVLDRVELRLDPGPIWDTTRLDREIVR